MENARKVQQWYRTIAEHTNNSPSALLGGLGLVVVLGSLAGLNPLLAVVCALALLLLVVVAPRPILIVYTLTFLLPLLGGFARGAVIPFLRLGQAVLLVGFILFMLARPGRQGKSYLTAIDLAFVLFFLSEAVFPVLALLYRGEALNLSSVDAYHNVTPLQTLLGPIQYYLLYRIVVATISSEKQITEVLKLSFVASIIVSAIGILQKLGVGPVKKFLDTYYPSPTLFSSAVDLRISSTLESYSGLAAYLCFTIIVALACYALQKRQKISPLLLISTLLLDSFALILTGTLVALVGVAIGAIVVFLLARRLPKLVIFVLIGIALALLIFQPFISDRLAAWSSGSEAQGLLPQTYAYRIRLWEEIFLPAISQHLLFGAGPAPSATNLWPSAETEYFDLLLRGGLLYLFSYLLLIGLAVVTCLRQIKSKSEGTSRTVAVATLAIIIALSVMNASAVYFGYVGGTQTIWVLLAIVVASGQFKELEVSTSARSTMDGKWRVESSPSQRSKSSVTAISLVHSSASAEPEVNGQHGHHQHLAWITRLLDWHFVKDSIVVGAGSMIARVLGLLFMVLVARFLTPDDFGFFRYEITLVGIITIATTASPVSMTRFLAANLNDNRLRDRYFSNGVFGVILLLVISTLISVPILYLLHALDLGTISCILGLTAFYGYLAVVRGLNNAWKMSLTYVLSNVAQIMALFVVFDLFRLRMTTVALVIYGLTEGVPIIVLELIRPMAPRFHPSLISRAVLLELIRFSTPIVLATGAFTLWSGIDLLFVENFIPHAEGGYAAAKTLASAFLIVPSVITMVLMPRVAALSPDESKRYGAGAVIAALLVSLVGLTIVGIWGHTLIALTFGQHYSDAYFPLLILSVGMSIYAVYAILEGFIIGRGQPTLAVRALVVTLLSSAVTGFWLTARLGTLGASLSFTIGAAFGTLVMLFNTWSFLHRDKQVASG